MSCQKKDCCNRPREQMLDAMTLLTLGEKGARAVYSLLALAKTGVADMAHFPDAITQNLALEIMGLWRQAQGVEAVALAADNDNTEVVIRFGPGKQYSLMIPVSGPTAKKELADSLRKIAADLDQPPADDQLPLPFDA